jgi:hypothetical protein
MKKYNGSPSMSLLNHYLKDLSLRSLISLFLLPAILPLSAFGAENTSPSIQDNTLETPNTLPPLKEPILPPDSTNLIDAPVNFMTQAPLAEPEILKSFTSPVSVKVQTVLNSQVSKVGEPFGLLFDTPHCLKEYGCIPAGTLLKGQVTEVKSSKRLHRPGILGLEIQEALLPDNSNISFDEIIQKNYLAENAEPISDKKLKGAKRFVIHNKDGTTLQQMAASEVYGTVPSLIIPIALKRFTSLSSKAALKSSFALGLAVDVVQEVISPTFKKASVPARAGMGLLNYFWITDAASFAFKEPDLVLSQGQVIKIKLPEQVSQALFEKVVLQNQKEVTGKVQRAYFLGEPHHQKVPNPLSFSTTDFSLSPATRPTSVPFELKTFQEKGFLSNPFQSEWSLLAPMENPIAGSKVLQ